MSDIRVNIWRLQAQSDIPGLIKAIGNSDSGIRKRAAAALRTLDAKEATPALTQALETESDPDTRAHILAALEQLADEVDEELEEPGQDELEQNRVSMLIARLGSRDSKKIISAAQKLGDLNDKQAAEPLVVTFNDGTLPIKARLVIAETLLKLECAPTEVSLLGATSSPDWRIRRKAVAVLGRLKADWAIEPMSKLLIDEHPQVRKTAFAALKHIGTPQAVAVLKVFIKAQKRRTASLKQVQITPEPESPLAESSESALEELPEIAPAPPELMIQRDESPPAAELPEKRRATGLLARVQTDEQPVVPAASEDEPPEIASTPEPALAADEPAEDEAESTPSKLSWPKRKPPNTIAYAPTRPLDPRVLEEARRRRSGTANTESDDDTSS